jgi:ligand-binding SRPBCC domain-containing protein
MKIYHLKRTQFLPISQREAWDFFSSPKNLGVITPQRMNFKILSMSGGNKMYAGQIITYKVSVLPSVRMKWVTEISHVQEPDYFTDEQRFGPFALWHHKHHFKSIEGGVEMTDELDYAIPLGVLGRLAHWLLVEREVNTIFEYRNKVLENLFPEKGI